MGLCISKDNIKESSCNNKKDDSDKKIDYRNLLRNLMLDKNLEKLEEININIIIENINYILNIAFGDDFYLNIIEWANNEHLIKNIDVKLLIAAKYGSFNIIEWANNERLITNIDEIFFTAARYDSLNTIIWAISNNLIKDIDKIFFTAAMYGSLNTIIWAISNNLIDKDKIKIILYIASLNGRYYIIKWAKDNNYQFDDITYYCAHENNWYKTRDYIYENITISDNIEEIFVTLYQIVLKNYNLGKNNHTKFISKEETPYGIFIKCEIYLYKIPTNSEYLEEY